ENILVLPDTQCVITNDVGSSEQGRFTIIRCTSPDRMLQSYFLRLLDGFLKILGPSPSARDIAAALGRLVELFRALARPASNTIQGLWSELFVIANGNDPIRLAAAWHVSPTDIYDFNAGELRLEVKSSSRRYRQHTFSLNQLKPPDGSNLVIVSLFVE